MAIRITLDAVLRARGSSVKELSSTVKITPANLSILKNSKSKALRFSTLDALCRALHCQPGDLLSFDGAETYARARGQQRNIALHANRQITGE